MFSQLSQPGIPEISLLYLYLMGTNSAFVWFKQRKSGEAEFRGVKNWKGKEKYGSRKVKNRNGNGKRGSENRSYSEHMFYTHQHRGQKIIFSFSRQQTLAIQQSCSDLVYFCDITAKTTNKQENWSSFCLYFSVQKKSKYTSKSCFKYSGFITSRSGEISVFVPMWNDGLLRITVTVSPN